MRNNKVPTPPFYYGWVIVIISAIGVFFSGPGQTFAVSMFIELYEEEFEFSRPFISNLYSAATLMAGFLLFTIGKLTDLYGQRLMMVVVGIALALATFWNAMITGPVMMFLGFFMLRLFGQGSMTLLPNTLVPQWFMRKRGRALSIMAIGGFAGAALFPPLNAFLVQQVGWRSTWVVWGVALLVIFVPLVLIFVRNQPADKGEVIDGKSTSAKLNLSVKKSSRAPLFTIVSIIVLIGLTLIPTIQSALNTTINWFPSTLVRIILLLGAVALLGIYIRIKQTKRRTEIQQEASRNLEEDEDQEISWTLKEAMKTRAFWVVLICVSIPALTNTGITFHLVSIAETKGFSLEIAAFVLSLMAIIGFPVTFISGYLADKVKVNYLLSGMFAIHVVAIGTLYFVSSATGAIIYGVIWGICSWF
ncbi:MFS transporter [Piscibacillus salipiscarius]|uniref:MFS transporter n=1 Tax=Piscibacillus salipiscarius TaxID=299480 RepID=UPI000AE8C19E|nr:MFS transporter [Piscibacillus salipiscarius]